MTDLEKAIQRADLAPDTRALYLQRVRAFVEYAGASRKHWHLPTAQAWRLTLMRNMDASAVNGYVAALKRASKDWSKSGGWDFARTLARAKQKKRAPRKLPDGSLRRLADVMIEGDVQTPVSYRDRAMVHMLACGYSRAAVLALRCEEYGKYAGPIIFIQAWRAHLLANNITTGPLFRRIESDGSIAPVAISGPTLNKIVRRWGDKAGIKNLTPHMLTVAGRKS